MHVKTFLAENMYFDANNKLASATTFLNSTGNFFLAPARHLLQGRTVTCVIVRANYDYQNYLFGNINDRHPHGMERLFKTVVSILLVIPCTILGTIAKGTALLGSSCLRERYHYIEELKGYVESKLNKAANDVAISLFKKDATRLLAVLKNLKKTEELDRFITYFSKIDDSSQSNGNLVFLREYPHLYSHQMSGINRVRNPSVEYVIGCFLKLYADEKIAIPDFFSKMKLLDEYAIEDAAKARENIRPIQKVIDLENNLETMTQCVERYLDEKGFFKKVYRTSH